MGEQRELRRGAVGWRWNTGESDVFEQIDAVHEGVGNA
jgi:hypothetical protein